MIKVDFSFIIDLKSYNFETWFKGPLFHKWLPDNENDAIELQAFKESIKINVWFERRGFMRDKKIIYDVSKKEVDPTKISKQYLLSGGYLFGSFVMNDISREEVNSITQDLKGNMLYENLGKRIAKMLAPPIINFLDILRINYGQYWLKPFYIWDSRKQSIGSYCRRIFLRWKINRDDEWHDFIPNRLEDSHTIEMWGDEEYLSYLSEEDWENIRGLMQTDFTPDLALKILNRAHEEWDNENYSRAIVDAITALEIAMSNKFKKINIDNEFQTQINKLNDKLDLDSKIFAIFYDLITKEKILDAIECKNLRNRIIHDGVKADKSDKKKILGIVSCIESLYPDITLKFPSIEAHQTIELE